MAGAAFVVLFMAYGIQFSYGVWVTEIGDDLGWSRSETALPYSVYVFIYSALGSVAGSFTDRWGPRVVIAVGGVLLGLGWGLSALVQQPWHLGVTLGTVTALGMSATWVPCNATVARWFSRRRGTAVAIGSAGGSLGGFVVPPVAATLLSYMSWRMTLATIALVSGALIFGAAQLMARDPESMGLWPDGDLEPPPPAQLTGGLSVVEIRWTTTFWLVIATYLMSWLVVFMPFVHGAAYGIDLGLSKTAAATVISAIGIGGVAGRLLAGVASDRVGRFPALAGMFAIEILSFFLFVAATDLTLLWPAAFLFGFGYGGTVALLPPLCGDLFGRAHVASVVGAIFARAGSPAAIGPLLAGWIYDATASYEAAFMFAAAVNGVALLMTLLLWHRVRRGLTPSFTGP
ncbi:MAG: MFS transporter [Actinomycetia bacterium]|nr:MFS transporter [Actinomycetes bacterium]